MSQQWIPCRQELPDADETVMTFAPESFEPVWPRYFDGEKWCDPLGRPVDYAEVTHWMPFPEPPEGLL